MEKIRNNEMSKERSTTKATTSRRVLLWSVIVVLIIMTVLLLVRILGIYTPVQTRFVYNRAELVAPCADEAFGWYDVELTPEETAVFLPEQLPKNMQNPISLHFSNTHQLTYLQMNLNTSIPGQELYIQAIQTYPMFQYRGLGKPVISKCGDVRYKLYRGCYRNPNTGTIALGATATIDGVMWYFYLDGYETTEDQMKAELETVLTYFAQDCPTADEIKALEPKGDPKEYTKKLTQEEALADPQFGAFLPADMPEELVPRYFLRIKSDNQNELSCRWSAISGYYSGSIDWDVEEFHGVNNRQGSWAFKIEDLELANMQAMLEGADAPFNSNGASRYAFSVVFDDVIVHIIAQDVDLEVLYNIIISLQQK